MRNREREEMGWEPGRDQEREQEREGAWREQRRAEQGGGGAWGQWGQGHGAEYGQPGGYRFGREQQWGSGYGQGAYGGGPSRGPGQRWPGGGSDYGYGGDSQGSSYGRHNESYGHGTDENRERQYWQDRSRPWQEGRNESGGASYGGRFEDAQRGGGRSHHPGGQGWTGHSGQWSTAPGRPPKGYQRSDERIREDVCEAIVFAGLDASEVEVRVEQAVVTLTGTVEHRRDKRRIEDVSDAVAGVKDINNQIRVGATSAYAGSSSPQSAAGRGNQSSNASTSSSSSASSERDRLNGGQGAGSNANR